VVAGFNQAYALDDIHRAAPSRSPSDCFSRSPPPQCSRCAAPP
jgi:hypothetical protein